MLIDAKLSHFNVQYNNTNSVMVLGIIFDPHLALNAHIVTVKNETYFRINHEIRKRFQ